MKILYDHLGFLHEYGGVPKYYIEMLRHVEPDLFKISVHFSNNYYLKKSGYVKVHSFLPNSNFKGKYTLLNNLNKLYSTYALLKGDYDIYHQTLYDTYALKFLPKSKIHVTTMHDLNFSRIPQYYSNHPSFRKFLFLPNILNQQKESAIRADHIIAISNNTKNDLIELWNIDPNKITVIYHGITPPIKNLPETKIHKNPYILYVGSREKYKNFNAFVKAFSLISDKTIDLICTGNRFTNAELHFFKIHHLEDRVFCYQASEYDMAWLYRDALCFVYPSFYEGFGMPILEAMNYGCPVVLSNTSCFPEIASNAGLYFNPNDYEDIKDKIEKICYNNELRNELINYGYKRVKEFSWEKTAKEHFILYKSLLN